MSVPLGRMEKINLREGWSNEASDFTPWLSKEENIALLGEALGIDLEVQKQEASVGPFRADILCKETETGRPVLIENQLEATDHSHLGQILTYAAGLDTPIIVWISQEFTEQHRAVLDWLNEKTDGKLNFFGVEVELWKIGNSPLAPKFNVVSKPNDWSNQLKKAVMEGGLTETEQLRLEYWTALSKLIHTSGSALQCKEAGTRNWFQLSPPARGFRAGFEMTVRDQSVDVYFGTRYKERAEMLARIYEANKEKMESAIGEKLECIDNRDSESCWLTTYLKCDPTNRQDWVKQQLWLKNTAEKMIREISKYLSDE